MNAQIMFLCNAVDPGDVHMFNVGNLIANQQYRPLPYRDSTGSAEPRLRGAALHCRFGRPLHQIDGFANAAKA